MYLSKPKRKPKVKEKRVSKLAPSQLTGTKKKQNYTGITKLKKELDGIFSVFVRLRDSDEHGNCTCISCGRVYPINVIQNGHYYTRNLNALRFHEKNCNTQCFSCNCKRKGNYTGYTVGLINKYEVGVIDELSELSRKTVKFSVQDYKDMIMEYSIKAMKIAKQKSLTTYFKETHKAWKQIIENARASENAVQQ